MVDVPRSWFPDRLGAKLLWSFGNSGLDGAIDQNAAGEFAALAGGRMGLLCVLLGHQHRRSQVWHDDRNFRAPCSRCGASLIHDHRTKTWRPYNETDDHEDRIDSIIERR
jgi:hypothetical protein